jgi:hypothetical protein
MGEKIRSWLIMIAAWITGITLALLIFFSPQDAASFAGWCFDAGKQFVSSAKVFVEEFKKRI